MKLLIDNSIVFKLFIAEDKSDEVRKLFSENHDFIFLDFTLIEAANSFASAVKRSRIDDAQANANFSSLMTLATIVTPANQFLQDALELALEINHSVYDCLYAVAAQKNGATLVTCDAKFAAKLNPANYQTQVI
jgi:predicted nucleic acid-binding protein